MGIILVVYFLSIPYFQGFCPLIFSAFLLFFIELFFTYYQIFCPLIFRVESPYVTDWQKKLKRKRRAKLPSFSFCLSYFNLMILPP